MVVCKFFLQNSCKFGEKCRYEHPRGGGGAQRSLFGGPNQNWENSGSPRVTFRDSFGTAGQDSSNQYKWAPSQQSSQGSDNSSFQQTTTLELVNSLSKEMETWEKSHMWPFSCISVDKDLPSLPDFYDICPEELRFEAYQAMKSGNLQPYTQRFQSLQGEFQNKRRQLQHMTYDLKSKLMAVIDESRKQAQSDSSSSLVFGSAQPTQSLFGQQQASTQPTQSLFGQQQASTQPTQSLFGQQQASTQPAQSLFGQQQASTTPSLFGKSTGVAGSSSSGLFGTPTSGSVFGGHFSSGPDNSGSLGSPGSSLFGKPIGTGSVFGNQSQGQTAQIPNLFGQQNQSNTPGLFGQPANQGQQNQINTPSLFGQPANQGQQNQSNTPSLFGQPANQGQQNQSNTPSLFGQPANQGQQNQSNTSSLFGQPTNQGQQGSSLFGNVTSPTTNLSSNVFGNLATSSPQGLFGKPATGLFGVPASQSQPSATLFGKPILQSSSAPQNLFGSMAAGQGSGDMIGQSLGVSSASPTCHGIYTPLADLTEQEKEAFNAKSFELGRIPIRPPPRELIN